MGKSLWCLLTGQGPFHVSPALAQAHKHDPHSLPGGEPVKNDAGIFVQSSKTFHRHDFNPFRHAAYNIHDPESISTSMLVLAVERTWHDADQIYRGVGFDSAPVMHPAYECAIVAEVLYSVMPNGRSEVDAFLSGYLR
jgi:hypothetical protein